MDSRATPVHARSRSGTKSLQAATFLDCTAVTALTFQCDLGGRGMDVGERGITANIADSPASRASVPSFGASAWP